MPRWHISRWHILLPFRPFCNPLWVRVGGMADLQILCKEPATQMQGLWWGWTFLEISVLISILPKTLSVHWPELEWQVTRRPLHFISTSTLTSGLTSCGPSCAGKVENSPCPSIIDFGWVCLDLDNSDAHLADGQGVTGNQAATTDPSEENKEQLGALGGSWVCG